MALALSYIAKIIKYLKKKSSGLLYTAKQYKMFQLAPLFISLNIISKNIKVFYLQVENTAVNSN